MKASALMLMPPAWISANDRALSEQHRAALAASSAPIEVMTSRIDAIVRHDQRARLGEIRLPALVIVAQDDMITHASTPTSSPAACPVPSSSSWTAAVTLPRSLLPILTTARSAPSCAASSAASASGQRHPACSVFPLTGGTS